jgi:hypothetical protein
VVFVTVPLADRDDHQGVIRKVRLQAGLILAHCKGLSHLKGLETTIANYRMADRDWTLVTI